MFHSFFSRLLPSESHGAFHRRASKIAVVVVLATLVVIRLISFANLNADHKEQLRSSLQSINNISVLVGEDIERDVEVYDQTLRDLADRIAGQDLTRLGPDVRQQLLSDRRAFYRDAGIGSLLVLDENGTNVLDSESAEPRQAVLSDREYFLIQKAKANVGLYISRPLHNRLRNGEWMIALSRRINHPDGSFAGIVVGAIMLDHFKRLFTKVSLAANDSITLLDSDGTIIVRWPFNESAIGQKIDDPELLAKIDAAPDGHLTLKALVNGTERLRDYRRIGNLPLIQSVGITIHDNSFVFWVLAAISVACFLILCAAVFILTSQLEFELRRRQNAETALEELATTDELTGLANRRKFDETLAFEWRRAERENTPFSLLMLDVDHFKAYNDTYGHQAGDKALRGIADCLKKGINRPADLVARYGGEEFAVLLPATDHVGAFHIAERIRQHVVAMALAHDKSLHRVVTASIGFACMYPRQTDDAALLVRAADDALYMAKASGRNRVAPPQQVNIRRVG